jgi:hypothetical protein
VLPVLGEHARKVVSRVQPYLATHFTAPSGVENVGSPQATNNVWTRGDIVEGRAMKGMPAISLPTEWCVLRDSTVHRYPGDTPIPRPRGNAPRRRLPAL